MPRSVIADRRHRAALAELDDYRRAARAYLPRQVFDFIEGGSYDEITLRENRRVFRALRFRQRVMLDVSARSASVKLFENTWGLPVALAPIGFMGMIRPDAEILVAQAGARAAVPFCLSTLSVCPMEAVAAAVAASFWVQLYLLKDGGQNRDLIARAKAAGSDVLVIGMDLHVEGRRNRDLHNGLDIPARLSWKGLRSLLARQGWVFDMLQARHKTLGNLTKYTKGETDLPSMMAWLADNLSPAISYRDVAAMRSAWPGKLIVKGILDIDDAKLAIDCGADAIIVSNHGGRQLDGAPAAISVLPSIVDAVGDRTTVLLDSGIRSGLDVLKGLAAGAKACLIGRAFLYGLGARGRRGVEEVLSLIEEELDAGMALTGTRDCENVARSVLYSA